MPHHIHSQAQWRARAKEARIIADQLPDAESRRIMLGIAMSYVQLAMCAEERANRSIQRTGRQAPEAP